MANDLISRAGILSKAIVVHEIDEGGWERILRAVPVEDIEAAEGLAIETATGCWIESKGDIRCSQCLSKPLYDYFGKQKLSKACPHCGAKMDE